MKKVLFVSHSKRGSHYYMDASARYRCVFPAENLHQLGITAHVVHVSQISHINLSDYQYLIAHRPQNNRQLRHYIAQARAAGVICIADFDDLLFTPDSADQSPAVLSGTMPVREAKRQAGKYKEGLALFDRCWVSTMPLVEKVNKYFPEMEVTFIPNKIPQRWATVEMLPAQERLQNKLIRYLPGTSHHKHDFALIEALLCRILRENPDIHLEVVGCLDINEDKFPPGQLSRLNFMIYEDLADEIARSWITIAPLSANKFNRCKSGLKFWESGIFGVPVISSPLPDAERLKNDGLIICNSPDEVIATVADLQDKEKYLNASQCAQKAAQQAVLNETDERISYLNITALITSANTVTAENWQQNKFQSNYMTALYGAEWPAKLLDPTTPEQNQVAKSLKNIPEVSSVEAEEVETYRRKAEQRKSMDMNHVKTSRVKRKFRKLYRTPGMFFRDLFKKHL